MSNAYIPVFVRKLVIRRAENRCEYCRLSQKGQEATFHIDHVLPVSEGGTTVIDNLALACVSCSLRKGAKRKYLDAKTGSSFPLFDPRNENWNDHFEWSGVHVLGKTDIGRVTVDCLNMNRRLILAIREEELLAGRSLS